MAIAFGVTRDSVALVTTPVSSNATGILLMPALLTGGTVVVMPKFDAVAALSAMATHRVTHAFAVPTAIDAMVAAGPPPLPELRALVSAGSHLRPGSKDASVRSFGPVVHELYGCTEGIFTILYPNELLVRPESVGRAVLGQGISVIGDDDQPAPTGEVGEVVGRGGGVMIGYHGRPEASAEAFRYDRDGRRWFRSGDLGRLDEGGYLTIVDRKKDMIVSGGYNVYPADIEALLDGHPGVRECAVVGAPHERWGETPHAFLVGDVDAREVVGWANARLAKHQRLAGATIVAALPRNALGKVLKRDLRPMPIV